MNITKYLEDKRRIVDEYLDKFLPASDVYPSIIHESMRYSIFAGGKRFRSILTLACAEACGANFDEIIGSACALEIIHAYSLIHDDLPAMDNDDYRRGVLSNHKKYGEHIAILAGDALLTLAFEIMDKEVVRDIAYAIGTFGVVGGQVVDMHLAREELELDLSLLEYIHSHKTGALIAVACKVGAKLAKLSSDKVDAFENYGKNIGFAFQIIDDIFDKDNYAVLLEEHEAKAKALSCIEKAKTSLNFLDKDKLEPLFALADFVVERED